MKVFVVWFNCYGEMVFKAVCASRDAANTFIKAEVAADPYDLVTDYSIGEQDLLGYEEAKP